jgi:hypothetical protein
MAEHPEFRFQYAAKFLCTSNIPGTSQTSGSVLPGVYVTVVNVHNPNSQVVRFRKKIAVIGHDPSRYVGDELKPDHATKVDCGDITRDFGISFIHGIEGFLVIESTDSLDVIAVYTAGKNGREVESIDVEHVPERRIEGRHGATKRSDTHH